MKHLLMIQGITLERFRKYRSASASFKQGLNVVRGPNEHGKSTLLSAILSGLFVNPARRNKQIESLRTWGEELLPRMSLKFTHNDHTYTLDADIEQKRFQLQRQHPDEPAKHWTTMQEAQEELSHMTGTTLPDVWLATTVVRHNDIAISSASAKHARQSLQQTLTASESSNTALEAINQLQKEWKSLQKGMDRPTVTPGPLKAVIDEMQGLAQHAQLVEQSVLQREQHEQRLEQLQEQLQKLNAEQKELQPQLDASQGYASAKKQYDLAKDRLDRVEGVMRQLTSINEVDDRSDSIEAQYDELQKQKQQLQDQLHELKYPSVPNALIAADDNEVKSAPDKPKQVLTIVLGAFAAVALVLAFILTPWLLLLTGGFTAAAILSYKAQQKRTQVESEKRASEREQKAQQQSAERAQQEQKLSEQMQEIEQQLNELQSKRVEHASQQTKRETLLAGKSMKEWEEEQKESRRTFISAEAKLEQLGEPIDQSRQIRLKQQLEAITKTISESEKEQIERQAQLNALQYTQEDLTQANERLFQLKQEKARLELRSDALTQAIEHLQQAQKNVTESAQSAIQAHVGGYMQQITDDKYDQVRMNDELELQIQTEGGWQSPSHVLSQGAQDQLALATRIALMQSMFPTTTPPLFLDDPFGSFDQQRLKATMELVKTLAQDRQIFLFTHSDQYDEWADHVVDVTKIEQREYVR